MLKSILNHHRNHVIEYFSSKLPSSVVVLSGVSFDLLNQLPMLPAKNPSLITGPGMAVLAISIVDLSHRVPLVPLGLFICTFYPNEIFGGKHGELIWQIKTNT